MRVGIDVDGILANFFTGYEKHLIACTGRDLFGEHRYPAELPKTWQWAAEFGYTAEEEAFAWREIELSWRWWADLEPLPGAPEFLHKLWNLEHEVYFITNRPGKTAQIQTQAWLMNYGYKLPSVIVSAQKGDCCATLGINVYLDDKPENVDDVLGTYETESYMLEYPYNATFAFQNGEPKRIQSLNDFLVVLKGRA